MTEPACVAVDWGTSSFRLWLVDRGGEVLAERRSDETFDAEALRDESRHLSLKAVDCPTSCA